VEKAAVIFWSATGNTEAMASSIAEGMQKGGADVEVFQVDQFANRAIGEFARVAFGCPAMGNEVLEEGDFEPFFASVEEELKGKKIALFGSYDWGDGEWMREWEARAKGVGAELFSDKGLIIHLTPDDEGAKECIEFGESFAKF
jgi:flavodoxin I